MIHANENCGHFRQQHKSGQIVILNTSSLSAEIKQFAEKAYRFSAQAEVNDIWLEIDFNDSEFERAVVAHIRKILAEHYTPFSRVHVEEHCPKNV